MSGTSKLNTLLDHKFEEIADRYELKDVILYALGLGLPRMDRVEQDLRFVFETDTLVLGSFVSVVAHPGFWVADPQFELDSRKIVHGEQRLHLHRALPAEADIVARSRISGIQDKGAGKGAVLHFEREISVAGGELLATMTQTVFCRGDGGMGSGGESAPQALPRRPDRDPDHVVDFATSKRGAFLYRMSGDLNPLHVVPEIAEAAGFRKPISHGLATYGVAGFSMVDALCDGDPARLRTLDCRFSAPAFPGETLRTAIWLGDGGILFFETRAVERDVVVLGPGRAEIAPAVQTSPEDRALENTDAA